MNINLLVSQKEVQRGKSIINNKIGMARKEV